jgi:alkylation response protein AidB-like acyl-CoA dehydrogenase
MSLSDLLATADRIATDVAGPDAARVDADAAFPTATVDALGASGLLGLVSATEVGGQGAGIRQAATVVERLARACASSAMVTCMHYAGAAVLERFGSDAVRREVAAGRHLTTLAFSEVGSRSHFWAPLGTARADGDAIVLDGRKSWATSARNATVLVWSSRPVAAEGASTLWLVPNHSAGLQVPLAYDGLGLRGNDSAPVIAEGLRIPVANRLGPDGGGFDAMMGVVLPIFSLMSAGCSIGIMDAALAGAATHAAAARHEHLGSALADLPTIRAYLARAKVRADSVRALWQDTFDALEQGRPDRMLRVLEVKAAAGEAALEVTAACMRVCGGAAYRKELRVERAFRDAQAASVMAPTTDQLYDFIGKAVCGLPLF